ncbi:MBL fold metallo-hydrolase [Bacteroidota bacterium]
MRYLRFILLGLIFITNNLFSQNDCKVTYIGNEGFLIEYAGKKIIVDGLLNNLESKYFHSPSDSVVNLLEKSLPPFDNIDIITISHKHSDHFDENIVVNHLLNNTNAKLICPKQVEEILIDRSDYKKISNRIIAITPDLYSDTTITVSDISIRVLRLEHSHYMEKDSTGKEINRHRNIENLGYLFNIEETKLFHCGDTNPLNEKEYSTFSLIDEEIDIAFLERIFFARGKKGQDILNNYISPKEMILMHIRPENINLFINNFKSIETVKIFENKMKAKVYRIGG